MTRPSILVLTGPTAVGKTEVALRLADCLPVDLISMDSAMVYRGMDVGTAKPVPDVLARYPHALVDIRDPAQGYSVAEFVNDADAAVRLAWQRGRVPVLVGGTMMYLRAFREGLAQLPRADADLRAELAEEARARGGLELHAELQRIDPVAAAAIHPNNPQRLQRALEVYRVSGRPISEFWAEQSASDAASRLGCRLVEVAVVPDDRGALHARIEQRFAAMLREGLVTEVRGLMARDDLHPDLPALRAVGYRQVWQHLQGDYDAADLLARGVAATRQLARRQLTWLRGWPSVRSYHWAEAADLARRIIADGHLAIY